MDKIVINGKWYYTFVFLIALILLSSSVLAASPFTSQGLTGMKIESPVFDAVKLNNDFRFHAHVINDTKSKTNITTSCFLHLYNDTGFDEIIANSFMEFENYNGVDFAYTIKGGNFTRYGVYAYVIQCNSSNEIAFFENSFLANAQGRIYTTADSVIYSVIFVILILTFIGCIWGSLSIPWQNMTTPEGQLYQINWKKYLKLFLFAMAYLTFVGISYFAWNITYGILNFKELSDFFRVLFTMSMVLIYPLIVVIIIVGGVTFFNDKKYEKFMVRGLEVK